MSMTQHDKVKKDNAIEQYLLSKISSEVRSSDPVKDKDGCVSVFNYQKERSYSVFLDS